MFPNVAELLLRLVRLPEDPEGRRRSYISRIVFGGVASAISLVTFFSATQIAFSIIRDEYYTGTVLSFSIFVFAISIISAAFYWLQLFLEFGGVQGAPSLGEGRGAPSDPPVDAMPEDSADEIARQSASLGASPRFIRVASMMRGRLRSEIRAQGRKANTNLGVGVLTAAIGLAVLGLLAWDASNTANNVAEALAQAPLAATDPSARAASPPPPMLYWGQFSAKVLLSVSSNIFAFFFLSTYRRNLSEIKYFQNEMTNVESHLVALYYAHNRKFGDIEKKIMMELARVERNFLLKRGETTADIQLKESDAREIAALVSLVSQLAKGADLQTTTTKRVTRR